MLFSWMMKLLYGSEGGRVGRGVDICVGLSGVFTSKYSSNGFGRSWSCCPSLQ